MKTTLWEKIRLFFLDSETIVWARLQLLIGAVWSVLAVSDLTGVLPAKYMPYWLILSGVITELVRRSRAPHNLGVTEAADLDTVMVPVKTDDDVKVNKAAGTITVTKRAIPAGVVTKKSGDRM